MLVMAVFRKSGTVPSSLHSVFPHSVMAAATTLTEGPALLFAILGTLAWIESASCPTVTASSFLLLILGAFFMGIAISCRQYYLALLPAVALFGLLRLRGLRSEERFVRLLGIILSLSVASAPVVLLIVIWGGLTSPGVATGWSHQELGWRAYAGLSVFRPIVAGFYSCFYLAPLTFPVVWRGTASISLVGVSGCVDLWDRGGMSWTFADSARSAPCAHWTGLTTACWGIPSSRVRCRFDGLQRHRNRPARLGKTPYGAVLPSCDFCLVDCNFLYRGAVGSRGKCPAV